MKLYVAGKYEERHNIKKLMQEFRRAGNTIVHDWTSSESDIPEGSERNRTIGLYAQDDLNAVKICDAIVADMRKDLNYRGSYGEIGIALGLGKTVIILGGLNESYTPIYKFVFAYLPFVHIVETPEEAISILDGI